MAPLLDVKQTAQLLNISPKTVYKWVGERKLPYVKMGDTVRFKEKDLVAFVEKRTVTRKRA